MNISGTVSPPVFSKIAPTPMLSAQKETEEEKAAAAAKNAVQSSSSPQNTQAATSPNMMSAETEQAMFDIRAQESEKAEEKPSAEEKADASPIKPDPREEFLRFMEMTPEERYFVLKLAERDLTKEEFEALPQEEQEKITREIQAEIREETEQQARTGKVGESVDTTSNAVGAVLSFSEIAAKYDIGNISPREVDQLAMELSASGAVPNRDIMMLMAHGEEFLSHLPGGYYKDEAKATAKMDLLEHAKWQRKMSGGNGWDSHIAFLERLQTAAKAG